MKRAILGFLLAIAGATPWIAVDRADARPLTPAERRYLPWTGEVPACDTPDVLGRIQTRFSESESEFWKSGLDMVGFDHFREIGFRTNGLDYIPRRYCTARVFLNNGKTHQITYWIGEDLGFAGGDYMGFPWITGRTNIVNNWGVTFCVKGLDRNYAYGPGCTAARP